MKTPSGDMEYWAANPDPKILAQKLESDRKVWVDQSVSSGIFAGYLGSYWRNTIAYYSNMLAPNNWQTSLEFSGQIGELIKMRVPRARMLTRQFVTIVTKQRLNYEVLTDVSDAEPQITAKLGKNICKNVHEENTLDSKIESAAELASTVGMSFLVTTWRPDKGQEYMPEAQKMNYTGAPTVDVADIADVMWDWTINDWKNISHAVVRQKRNRWDLIASHANDPAMVEKIRGLPSAETERRMWNNLTYVTGTSNDDEVFVYYFYHKPSPALPNGRMTCYSSPEIIYDDGINKFHDIPIEPIIFEKIKDTTLGYAMFSSLLPAQEMFDHCFSVSASNQSAFGVQCMKNPRGNKVTVEDIGGLRMFNYTPQNAEGGGSPEPLEFPGTPAEVMNFAQSLSKELGDMSYLNDTLRGQPPPNVTSGAMAATLSANALEFLNSAQKAIVMAIEKTMNHCIMAYKEMASVEQIVDITGDNSFAYVKKFKAADLKGLRRIKIRTQSPLMNSQAGRISLGETLVQQGLVSDAGKLIQLYEGAPVDDLFKGTWTENIAVQAEVDRLQEGGTAFPLETDNHPLYIAAYKEILDNPVIRESTTIPQTIIPLMKQRLAMEMALDPMLKAILRGQPMPQQAPQQGPNPGPAGGAPPAAEQSPELSQTVGQPAKPAQPIPMQ